MDTRFALRIAALLAALVAGSCSSQDERPIVAFQDGAQNHPITVEPVYRTLDVAYAGSLSRDDEASLAAFVDDYRTRGNGSISITAPPGPNATQTITALGERIAALGVPRSRILVGMRDPSDQDYRVELGYIGYAARTDPCGQWPINAADTEDNAPMPGFGCSVQHNIAAQLADPRDLVQTRPLDPEDAMRRMLVLNKYEQLQATQSAKTSEQSGAVSDIGSQ